MVRKGLFVTIEGIQGAGKTRLAESLATRLNAAKVKRVLRSEDTGLSEMGQEIRALMTKADADENYYPLRRTSSVLLSMAARIEDVARVIRPNLINGTVIVADTFHDTQLANEAAMGGVPYSLVESLMPRSVGECMPDITILLDGEVKDLLLRSAKTGPGPASDEMIQLQTRAREAFLFLSGREPSRFVLIDAMQPLEIIDAAVWKPVAAALNMRGIPFDNAPPNTASLPQIATQDAPTDETGKVPEPAPGTN